MRVIFILPGRGGGGGAHSVVQEAIGLRRHGVDVAIAGTADTATDFRMTYPELAHHGVPNPTFSDTERLARIVSGYDFAVATTAPSAIQLAAAIAGLTAPERPRGAYYVQDYEPLFFNPGTPEWDAARASYTAMPGALLFAKTEWLRSIVGENHNVTVQRVRPSLDHSIFFTGLPQPSPVVRIAAMLRPATQRRAPRRTARILERVAARWGSAVSLSAFGCTADNLRESGVALSPDVRLLGPLPRRQVASILRETDLFLDLSDYQAFGRTALEGMACGCVPVVPVLGGAAEFARDASNALVVDTRSDEEIMGAIGRFIETGPAGRAALRSEAILTALEYSVEKAAYSLLQAFLNHAGPEFAGRPERPAD